MLTAKELRATRDATIEIANGLSSAEEGARMRKIALIAPYAKTLSYRRMQDAGFNVGYALWRNARNFADRPCDSFAKSSAESGRNSKVTCDAIGKCIGEHTHLDSNGKPIVYLCKKPLVAELLKLGLSKTQAYEKCEGVKVVSKSTCLCEYCELLKVLRGGDGSKYDSQRITASHTQGLDAASTKDVEALMFHEKLAMDLHKDFSNAVSASSSTPHFYCAAFDWAGSFGARSKRGSSEEFFNPTFLKVVEMFGACIYGAGKPRYYVVFHIGGLPKSAQHTGIALQNVLESAIPGPEGATLEAWFDTARPNRCKYFITQVIEKNRPFFGRFEDISCNFFAEKHGKGCVDSLFSRVKRRLAMLEPEDISPEKIRGGLKDLCTPLEYSDVAVSVPTQQLRIPDVTAFHKYGRRGDSYFKDGKKVTYRYEEPTIKTAHKEKPAARTTPSGELIKRIEGKMRKQKEFSANP